MTTALVATLIVVVTASCAPHAQHAVPIAVLIDGDAAAVGPLARADSAVAPRLIALPAAPPPPPATATLVIAAARAAYVTGDLDRCRRVLDGVDVTALLGAGDRASAARALAFRAACEWAGTDRADAQRDARELASYGLELPEAAVAPDVEALLGAAIAAAGDPAQRPHALAIRAVVGARLLLDGRPAGCAAPCRVEVRAGDHVVAADADGFAPVVRAVTVPDVAAVTLDAPLASPALAATQWRARVGRGQPAADEIGASLIARFADHPRVAYVRADRALAGVLIVHGKVAASTQAARGHGADLLAELAYDGGVVPRPPSWSRRNWPFLVAAAGVVVAATAYVVFHPPSIHEIIGVQ